MAQADFTSHHPSYKIPWPAEKLKRWEDIERPQLLKELDKKIDTLARLYKWSNRQRVTLRKDLIQAIPASIVNHETLRMRFGSGVGAMEAARGILFELLGQQAVVELDQEMLDIAATLYAAQHRQSVHIPSVITQKARVHWRSLSLMDRRKARRLKARVMNFEPPFLAGRPRRVDRELVTHLRRAIEKHTLRRLTRSQRGAVRVLTLAYKIAIPTRPVSDAAILNLLRGNR